MNYNFVILMMSVFLLWPLGLQGEHHEPKANKFSVGEVKRQLMLVSTIEGTVHAVNPSTGTVLWSRTDAPVLTVPTDIKRKVIIPDPTDGSLYMHTADSLKKLPFTIPELVNKSPCKSSDGILYSGSKKDVWFEVNPDTGDHLNLNEVESPFDSPNTCTNAFEKRLHVGRTEYTITMIDSGTNEKVWNATFIDYGSEPSPKRLAEHGFHHYATHEGRLLTLGASKRSFAWAQKFKSAIVALYSVEDDGRLYKVPYTYLDDRTFARLETGGGQRNSLPGKDTLDWKVTAPNGQALVPTLFLAEYEKGWYALPSFADTSRVAVLPHSGPFLIEDKGDNPKPGPTTGDAKGVTGGSSSSKPGVSLHYPIRLFLGHHERPKDSEAIILPSSDKDVTTTQGTGAQSPPAWPRDTYDDTDYLPRDGSDFIYIESQVMLAVFTGVVGIVILATTVCLCRMQTKIERFTRYNEIEQFTNGPPSSQRSSSSSSPLSNWKRRSPLQLTNRSRPSSTSSHEGSRANGEESGGSRPRPPDSQRSGSSDRSHSNRSSAGSTRGSTRTVKSSSGDTHSNTVMEVGKISYDKAEVLGRGCEGTIVFKGWFDGRNVAVKRLQPQCFDIADIEVQLLRQSDQHPNVVRYHCTEEDEHFRYLALELARATLDDFVKGKVYSSPPGPVICKIELLRQMTLGLNHLHSLGIVHRDIKPHNVLLSFPGPTGEVKALISDFGLCKKLVEGRASFSKRSGVTGTTGWIAPELLRDDAQARGTNKVDIFSLGCLFYYVMSDGSHPFGTSDSHMRQARILNGEYDLGAISPQSVGCVCPMHLVAQMIDGDMTLRPSTSTVLKHPFFWSDEKKLTFFLDVSDFTDSMAEGSVVVRSLEDHKESVVRGDWKKHICEPLRTDLRRFRSYKETSVRDLLRAMRNKKHHYRELPQEVKASLGRVPDEFLQYFTSRFPKLLLHCYLHMMEYQSAEELQKYYESAS